jgi:hypothetical protein
MRADPPSRAKGQPTTCVLPLWTFRPLSRQVSLRNWSRQPALVNGRRRRPEWSSNPCIPVHVLQRVAQYGEKEGKYWAPNPNNWQWNSSISETVRNRKHVHIHFFLRMTDTMTSQNIDLSSWDTLYRVGVPKDYVRQGPSTGEQNGPYAGSVGASTALRGTSIFWANTLHFWVCGRIWWNPICST